MANPETTDSNKKKAGETKKVDPTLHVFQQEFKVAGKLVKDVKPRRLTGRDMLDIENEIQAVTPGKDFSSIGKAERTMRQIGKACGWLYEDV